MNGELLIKMKIDRMFIDKILGMTESRKEMEDKLMKVLEISDYHNATEKEKRLLKNITLYILGRDMQIIESTAKEILKKKKKKAIKYIILNHGDIIKKRDKYYSPIKNKWLSIENESIGDSWDNNLYKIMRRKLK